jgi:hypothetical protein
LIYKPWRRYIDKKRMRNAQFLPLPQSMGSDVEAPAPGQPDEIQRARPEDTTGKKDSAVTEVTSELTDDIRPEAGNSANR